MYLTTRMVISNRLQDKGEDNSTGQVREQIVELHFQIQYFIKPNKENSNKHYGCEKLERTQNTFFLVAW